ASSPTNAYLSAVSCADPSSCLAVGSAGTVLTSSDGGSTWSAQDAPSGDDVYGVSCSDPAHCTATGSDGTVASTGDGGQSWNVQGSGTSDALRSVNCPSAASCYAAGDYGALLKISPRPTSRSKGARSDEGILGNLGLGT